ncbi:MAG: UDP-2,3-diacylglucosamine diphosphatase [Saprospiraceae bacterium]|nr:UDP-2,3-diacylglucosamine diphosphatase [Saprospiraceae bacterium]
MQILLKDGKKIYFASDFHLGVDVKVTSKERERQLVRWLDTIKKDAQAIFLVGDVFDFWFEYSTVVPKGFVRILGKLGELSDAGIQLFFFTGNHDMWVFKYFEEELNCPTFRSPQLFEVNGIKMLIGHGDGLGPGDYGYKFIKKIFSNKICQWLFERFHPNFGIGLANFWSSKSREHNHNEHFFYGEDKEWLIQYCNEYLSKSNKGAEIDYFVFGHRHLPIDFILKNNRSRYINLGDWMNYNSFGVFDGSKFSIQYFENEISSTYTNH